MRRLESHFKTDLAKFYAIDFPESRPKFIRKLFYWLGNFGLHCVAAYRFASMAKRLHDRNRFLGAPVQIAAEIFAFYIRMIHHADIFAADIGPGFYISHVGNIYIGACIIGDNFSVTHNVTMGVSNSESLEGLPVVGSNVWVGTCSVIYGKITVGNGVTINSGSILTKSVPDNCLVGGNPARILHQNYNNANLFGSFSMPAAKPQLEG